MSDGESRMLKLVASQDSDDLITAWQYFMVRHFVWRGARGWAVSHHS